MRMPRARLLGSVTGPALLMIGALGQLVVGCAVFEDPPLPREHPANPEAPEASPPARSKTLDVAASEQIRPAEPAQGRPSPTPTSAHEHGYAAPAGDSPTAPTAGATPAAPKKGAYTCPMDEEVRSDRPGDCPKCGMKLVPEDAHKDHK